jgi:hypothetical protein
MDLKICTSCNIEKPINEFYQQKNRKNGSSKCKQCFNKYCANRWINRKIDSIVKKGSKCFDCTISYPEYPYVVFDFHHLNSNEKDFDWSKTRLMSEEKLNNELDKCVLLCSNCHRVRHYKKS